MPNLSRSRSALVIRPSARAWLLIAGLAVAGAVGGCGQADPVDTAIKSATERLWVLSTGGQGLPSSPAELEKGFKEVLATLGAASSAEGGQKGAVSLLTARAHMGLGTLAAESAAEMERRSLNVVQQLRALGRTYASQSASAAAAELFNPAEAIARQTEALGKRRTDLTAAKAQLAKLESEVKDLREQAARLTAQAGAKRDEASNIRASAQGQSQVAQLAAAERAAAISRESSKLDTQASMITAEANAREPLANAQRSAVAAMEEEIRRAESGIQELQTRAQVARELATTARASAAEASAGVARLVGDLKAMRSGDLNTKTEAALSAFSAALGAARNAPSGADAAAFKLAAAQAQLAKAQTLLLRARGVASVAGVLAPMKDAQPPMPEQAQVNEAAAAFDEEAKAKIDEAKAAIKEASEALAGGAGGDTAQYASALLAYVEAGDFSAPVPTMATAGAAASAPGGSTASVGGDAAAGDVETAVRTAMGDLIKAVESGDAGAIRAAFDARSTTDRQLLEMVTTVGVGQARLDKVCRAKYGKPLAEIAGAAAGAMSGGVGLPTGALDQMTVTVVSPTEAKVSIPGQPGSTDLRLVDGKWKIGIPEVPPEAAAQMAMMGPMIRRMGDLFNQLAGDVEDGRLPTPEAFRAAFTSKMAALMQSMGGPGGG